MTTSEAIRQEMVRAALEAGLSPEIVEEDPCRAYRSVVVGRWIPECEHPGECPLRAKGFCLKAEMRSAIKGVDPIDTL